MKILSDPFNAYAITAEQPGPHVLIAAGVHGDEFEPMLAVRELLQQLSAGLLVGKVTLVPVVNTSAFVAGTRYGSDGKDLARICPGDAEGTPTARSADAISKLIHTADYFIDMHTGGILYDLYPLCGYMLHPVETILKSQQKMAHAFGLPVIWGTDHYAAGRTLSVARDAQVPAIYVEYGGGTGIRPQVIDAYVKGCRNVLRMLGMTTDRGGEETEVSYWVEDFMINSGHLQAKLPAPSAGIFVPQVALGKQVKKDDVWGHVLSPYGEEAVVLADMDGLVFMLRAVVHVKRGDALGGILPILKPGKVVIHGT